MALSECNKSLRGIFSELTCQFAKKVESFDLSGLIYREEFRQRIVYHRYDLGSTDSDDVMLRTVDLKALPRFSRAVTGQLYCTPGPMVGFVPIGAYGPAWAEQVVLGVIALSYLLVAEPKTNILQECLAHDRTYSSLLREATFQKRMVMVLIEGIKTLGAATAILTAEKVAGYAKPSALYRDIVKDYTLNVFGGLSPLGTIIPMSQEGYFFPSALKQVNGKVSLSPETMGLLDREQALAHGFTPVSPSAHEGCPVARRSQGAGADIGGATVIQYFASLLAQIICLSQVG